MPSELFAVYGNVGSRVNKRFLLLSGSRNQAGGKHLKFNVLGNRNDFVF